MRFDDEIRMPSALEIDSAVDFIVDAGLPPRKTTKLAGLRLRDIVFGIEDCVAIAITVYLTVMGILSHMSSKGLPFVPFQFMLAPSLFAGLLYLSMWKDTMNRSVEWKQACRINYKVMTVYRMFLFGGISVVGNTAFNYLLWEVTGKSISFLWIMCFSFASLFLYGFVSLILLNRNIRYGLIALQIVWAVIGCLMFLSRDLMGLTVLIPVYAMLLILVLSVTGLALQIRKYLSSPTKGDVINAYY